MPKSVFLPRYAEIKRTKHINDLVRHLYDPERWPLDIDAHFSKLSGNALALAMDVLESHGRGDPEFRRYAEALTLAS